MLVFCARIFPIWASLYTGNYTFETPKEQSSGPSRTLASIIDVAEKKAHSIDKDAVLSRVDFNPVGYVFGPSYTVPATESLEYTFRYSRPNGREISIQLEDADPATTIKFSAEDTYADTPKLQAMFREYYLRDRGDLPAYMSLLHSYKLTPRDAVVQTWADSSNYISKQIVAKEQGLPSITTGKSDRGVPVWNVDYRYYFKSSERQSNGVYSFGFSVVSYVVNGEIGEIISRKYETITPTQTPEPWAPTH